MTTCSVAVESGVNLDVAVTVLFLFIRMMDEASTTKKVTELYGAMLLEFMTLVNDLPKESHSVPIEQALRFIDLHIYEEIDTQKLASFCGYTSRHMNRLFQKELNDSISHYMIRQRLSRAAKFAAFRIIYWGNQRFARFLLAKLFYQSVQKTFPDDAERVP